MYPNSINRVKLINLSIDKKISISLVSPFIILTLQYFILIFFNLLETSAASMVQMVSKILVGLVYIAVLPVVLDRIKIKFLIIYLVTAMLFLIHLLVFPENRQYQYDLIFPFFFLCLPSFLYSLSLRDFAELKLMMRFASYAVLFIGAVLGILVLYGKVSIGDYSMSLSYYMLLPGVIFCDELLEKYSFSSFLYVIICLAVILAFGSRGALICIFIFALLKLIKPKKHYTVRRFIGNIIVVSAGFLLYLNLNALLISLYVFLQNFGVDSRSLWIFINDNARLSGRDLLYEKVSKEVAENPLIGIGLAGDRRILNGSYVHNVFLEIISNFGFAIGLTAILFLLALILRLLVSKNINQYNMTIIWFSLGFVHLMVSTSYLIDMKFWIFLGLLVNMASKSLFGEGVQNDERKNIGAFSRSQI